MAQFLNTSITGTLGVSGAVSFATTLGVTGAVTFGGTLSVAGAVTLTLGLSVGGTLGVTGNATFGGTAGFTGAITAPTVILSLAASASGHAMRKGEVDAAIAALSSAYQPLNSNLTTVAGAAVPAAWLTGVIDVARLPIFYSGVQVVSAAASIAALSGPEQAAITSSGAVVTTTDGRRWVWNGVGSKVLEASYVELGDVTPAWAAIANKPTTLAGYSIVIASQAEAEAGVDTGKAMTPQRTAQAITALESDLTPEKYGAVGDGAADDGPAMRLALAALEAGVSDSLVLAPNARYRLATKDTTVETVWSENGYTSNPLLALHGDLAGRRIAIYGNEATLYHDAAVFGAEGANNNAPILSILGSFRSLLIDGVVFEKHGGRCIGRDNEGVLIEPYEDDREVESVHLDRCTFINCHRAYSIGSYRTFPCFGKLKQFTSTDCVLLYPYGANTLTSTGGGGQMTQVLGWVKTASFIRERADGASSENWDNPTYNADGVIGTCTFSSGSNLVTCNGHGVTNGAAVTFSNSGGAPPPEIAVATKYYARDVATNTLALALTPGGAVIDLSTNGTGTSSLRRRPQMKDGHFFGMPLETTTVRDCVTRNTAIESFYHLGQNGGYWYTPTGFTIPAANDTDTFTVVIPVPTTVHDMPSGNRDVDPTVFALDVAGGVRIHGVGYFTLRDWDAGTKTATLSNPGTHAGFTNPSAATVISAADRNIYLYGGLPVPVFDVQGSTIEGAERPSDVGFYGSDCRCRFVGNQVINARVGFLVKSRMATQQPGVDVARGSEVRTNFVLVSDHEVFNETGRFGGVQIDGTDDATVDENTIVVPAAHYSYGVGFFGDANLSINSAGLSARGNQVLALRAPSGGIPSSSGSVRAIGYTFDALAPGVVFEGNTSRGFTFGLGPVLHNTNVACVIWSHQDSGSTAAIDDRGPSYTTVAPASGMTPSRTPVNALAILDANETVATMNSDVLADYTGARLTLSAGRYALEINQMVGDSDYATAGAKSALRFSGTWTFVDKGAIYGDSGADPPSWMDVYIGPPGTAFTGTVSSAAKGHQIIRRAVVTVTAAGDVILQSCQAAANSSTHKRYAGTTVTATKL